MTSFNYGTSLFVVFTALFSIFLILLLCLSWVRRDIQTDFRSDLPETSQHSTVTRNQRPECDCRGSGLSSQDVEKMTKLHKYAAQINITSSQDLESGLDSKNVAHRMGDTNEIPVPGSANIHFQGCGICIDEEFTAGETVRTLPCQHSFHPNCVDKWLFSKGTCPTCRYPLYQPAVA